MGRLLIISNRLPYSLDTSGQTPVIRQSSGGLVSAIKSYFEKGGGSIDFTQKVWIGSSDISAEDWKNHQGDLQGSDFSVEPIFVDDDLYDKYYNGFSNSTLWPLFHYFPSLTVYEKEFFDAFVQVNKLFASHVNKIMQPGDVVWVHDYQLMLMPQIIRNEHPDATIGFFLHIPFPSYEIYRLMPTEWKTLLLHGLMGADLVGFHTYDYVQYFIQSAKMILGVDSNFNMMQYKNRLVKADLFPIGIDFNKFREAIEDKEVIAYRKELAKNFSEKKIIFSVDRLDYTKGLTYRLQGYENFLERYPEWRGKVVFIFNIVPSRDTIPTYNDRKRMIEEKVSTINGKYSTIHWQPLIYRYNHLEFHEMCGLYQEANIALITPLRDGMNLVAKEYVASCDNGGVLILSELTGAAAELNEAFLVNPTDVDEIAESIAASLVLPLEDQKARMQIMQNRLRDYDVINWVDDFLEQLLSVKKEQEKLKVKLLEEGNIEHIRSKFESAGKRAILLDYDGTLAAFKKIPGNASPSPEVLEFLKEISEDPKNEVVIISGRDADTLQKWLGHLHLNFVAEHGVFVKYKDEEEKWDSKIEIAPGWKEEVKPLLESYVTRCAGSIIEEKKHTLSWHYRNTHPGLGFIRSRELLRSLMQLTANTPLQIIDGNKVLEIRLTGVDKGATARKVIDKLNPDFIFCIGDDTTDEDMFKALSGKAYTVKVGNENTAAGYKILTQQGVLPILQKLFSSKSAVIDPAL